MKKHDNVFLIAQEMEDLIWKHSNVYVMKTGSVMTAHLDCVALTVETMEGINNIIKVTERYFEYMTIKKVLNHITNITLLLSDAKIQNAYALRDGRVFDVSLKTVIHDVTFMDNAKMVHAYVFLVGMESTAL